MCLWNQGARPPFCQECKLLGLQRGKGVICTGCHIVLCPFHSFFFFLINFFKKIIYLFMAVLVLRFCARAFSSCGERGPLFITVRGPPTIAASLVAEHRLQQRRLSNCGSRAQPLRGTWDLPRPGLELVSPALAGRLSTTAPPGKPCPFHSLSVKGAAT